MALKMGGCNYEFNSAKSPQGEGRVRPADFARNSLSKGGVNQNAAGSDEWGKHPGLMKGQTGQGKRKDDKR